jgi:hypothetical protein
MCRAIAYSSAEHFEATQGKFWEVLRLMEAYRYEYYLDRWIGVTRGVRLTLRWFIVQEGPCELIQLCNFVRISLDREVSGPQVRVGVCAKWYQSLNFISVREKFDTMPPRRHRDRPVENPTMEEEMRRLCARLDAMETTQRRAPNVGDISEVESEEVEVEGAAGEEVAEERLLRVVVKIGAREKMEVPMYEGNLDVEELLDW